MTLGQRIKQLRLDKELNQPELAQAIGIEQSYLSKLENDKAFPSDEMFEKLLQIFSITVEGFIAGFNQSTINNQLMKLTAVNKAQTHLNTKSVKYMLKWILVSALLGVLGVTLLVTGEREWAFKKKHYFNVYQSMGVVKDGESLLLFEEPADQLDNEVLKRIDPKTINLSKKNGRYFVREDLNENPFGLRYYSYSGQIVKSNFSNNALRIIGLLLTILGIVGLIIEPKIRRIKLLIS